MQAAAHRLQGGVEWIVLALACLAPWAFGAVEAWSELCLYGGIALAALLSVVSRRGSDWRRRLFCLPSVSLGGLALLALVQSNPLPEGVLSRIDPASASLRRSLIPRAPERVIGDDRPVVALPPLTLSQDPEAARDMAVRLASAWVLFQVVLGLGPGVASFRRFGVATAGNATLLSVFSIIQALSWNGKIYWCRPTPHGPDNGWAVGGPFVCHSHLAEYLNIGLGFALGILLAGRRRESRRGADSHIYAWGYAAGIIAVGIVTSQSRGGMLSMLGAGAMMFVAMRTGLRKIGMALLAILGLMAVCSLALGDIGPYIQRFATVFDSSDRGYSLRIGLWGDALGAWRAHPFLGTGLGSFGIAVAPYLRHDHGKYFARAENEYVDMLIEGGVAGLLLALVALVGIGRMAWAASKLAPRPEDRFLILGGMFGGVAVLLHAMSDFGLHIPGVSVTMVILAAHLSRLGLVSEATLGDLEMPNRVRVGAALSGLAIALLGLGLVHHGIGRARAELAQFSNNWLPAPNFESSLSRDEGGVDGAAEVVPAQTGETPTLPDNSAEAEDIGQERLALEQALRFRPDWGQGYLKLGVIYWALYQESMDGALREAVPDERLRLALADPLWLRQRVHSPASDEDAITREHLLESQAVKLYLIPAARCYLQARRCTPFLPLPHAKLAALDFLLQGGDTAEVYLKRALALSGADTDAIAQICMVALQAGASDITARAWRKALNVNAVSWNLIADAARRVFTPDQILRQVVPNGRYAILFANRLYAGPEDAEARKLFLETALERLPHDPDLPPAERLHLEAEARFGLDERDKAAELMKEALALEPARSYWRKEFVEWLVEWGDLKEAHDQAVIGVHFTPNDGVAVSTLKNATEVFARGKPWPQPRR